MTAIKLNTLVVSGTPVSEETLAKLKDAFTEVHYYPDPERPAPKELWDKVEAWYVRPYGLPTDIQSVGEVPRLKLLQLTSAGANLAVGHAVFKSEEGRKQITISSASGIHVFSIPQYIVSQTVNREWGERRGTEQARLMAVYMNIYVQTFVGRDAKWSRGLGFDGKQLPTSRSLYGKTAGLLGYGHIARETARQLKALNVRIIAANSRGTKSDEDGVRVIAERLTGTDEQYIVPHTGDPDGSIPEAYYSTADQSSFDEFLSKSDILIASLPSTPATRYLLTKKHFGTLPEGAVFINVGRGDLARSDDILAALDAPKGLSAVALDVTDPEPLSDGHPLWTHPRAVITPHTSGEFVGYFDKGADLLLANVAQYRRTGRFFNVIDPVKGY